MNHVRERRQRNGWSQQDLASRAGVTRQLVGAVETGRQVPSVTAALALAAALGTTVEALFPGPASPPPVLPEPLPPGTPVMVGQVGDDLVALPSPPGGTINPEQWDVPDAVLRDGGLDWFPDARAGGLVIAGCDPVIGVLARLLAPGSALPEGGHRVRVVHASTAGALRALARGWAHVAVIHGPDADLPTPPAGVRCWHLTRWQVGLAAPGVPPPLEELAGRGSPVVQRDPGAGGQQALERALGRLGASSRLPGPVATGHVDVARRLATAGGDGRAGVTMETAARAFRLGFTPLEDHAVELWMHSRWTGLPAAQALLGLLSSRALRRRTAHLPGYDMAGCGTERP